MLAVNAAVTLERLLLVKGDRAPARRCSPSSRARSPAAPAMAHQVDDQGAAGLYEYDAVSRLRDSQLGDEHVGDIALHQRGAVGRSRRWRRRSLIDESTRPTSNSPTTPCASSTDKFYARRSRRSARGIGR
jgi:hypothetical protein